jgi:hypothetical protein
VPIILERRRIVGSDYCIWTEYLVKEVRRYVAEHPKLLAVPRSD